MRRTMSELAYVCCSNSTLMTDLELRKGGSKRTGYLPCMNASNHLRRAVSSLTRENMRLGSAITANDRPQCLLKVLVECGGPGQLWEVGKSDEGAQYRPYRPSRDRINYTDHLDSALRPSWPEQQISQSIKGPTFKRCASLNRYVFRAKMQRLCASSRVCDKFG